MSCWVGTDSKAYHVLLAHSVGGRYMLDRRIARWPSKGTCWSDTGVAVATARTQFVSALDLSVPVPVPVPVPTPDMPRLVEMYGRVSSRCAMQAQSDPILCGYI